MQAAAKILALAALALTVVPPALFLFHHIAEPLMKGLMVAGCALWFCTAPFWLKGGAE